MKGHTVSKVKNGDSVKVHYKGTLEDGTVFDSSEGREPLAFTLGAGQLIAGFEKAVIGLEEGETTTTHIPAAEAYGEHRPEMTITVPKSELPADMEVHEGLQLQLNQPDGQPIPVVITNIEDDQITLDANHPLAGKDLTFEIRLVEID